MLTSRNRKLHRECISPVNGGAGSQVPGYISRFVAVDFYCCCCCSPLSSIVKLPWKEMTRAQHETWRMKSSIFVAAAAMLNIKMEVVKSLFWSRCQILKNCGCRVMDSYGKVLCFSPEPYQHHVSRSHTAATYNYLHNNIQHFVFPSCEIWYCRYCVQVLFVVQ